MSHLDKIHGPSSPHDPLRKKESQAPDEKFKEMMEIKETDPDEQTRGYRPGPSEEYVEKEEEPAAEVGKTPEKRAPSQLRIGKGAQKEPSEKAFAAYYEPPPSTESVGEVELFAAEEEEAPYRPPSRQEAAPSERRPSAERPHERPAFQVERGDKEKGEKAKGEDKTSKEEEKLPEKKIPTLEKREAAARDAIKKPLSAQDAFEDVFHIPPQEEQEEEALPAEGIAPTPLTLAGTTPSSAEKKEAEKKEKPLKMPETLHGMPQAGVPPENMPEPIPPPTALPSYTHLHPQVLDLFERMVGVMTVMHDKGIKETTLSLTAPQFASSVFYGSDITIREFSTAPKVFNVELSGSPQAVALFQSNAGSLLASFQDRTYAFRVQRVDATIRRVEERKENSEGEGEE